MSESERLIKPGVFHLSSENRFGFIFEQNCFEVTQNSIIQLSPFNIFFEKYMFSSIGSKAIY